MKDQTVIQNGLAFRLPRKILRACAECGSPEACIAMTLNGEPVCSVCADKMKNYTQKIE